MAAVTLQGVIQAIQNQIPALGRDPFTIDQTTISSHLLH